MKRKSYPPKRVTLLSLILRALAVVTVLSLVFAWLFGKLLRREVNHQCEALIRENQERLERNIADLEAREKPHLMQEITGRLTFSQMYDVTLIDPLFSGGFHLIMPQYSDNCHCFAALLDENGDIAASSRQVITAFLRLDEEGADDGFYLCDNEALQMPEVDKLYADYQNLMQPENGMYCYVQLDITSAYIDRNTRTFIPHEAVMTRYQTESIYDTLAEDPSEGTEYPVQITIDDPDYELIELYPGRSRYPNAFLTGFNGETREVMEMFEEYVPFVYGDPDVSYHSVGFQKPDEDTAVYWGNSRIYIDKQPYWMNLRFLIHYNDPEYVGYYWKYTLLFAGIAALTAALWVWRRNVINQAKYAFEDYQRDLTNSLAHDIKTPLTAIGGYAENILDGSLTPEEQNRYLHAILENIAFTDSLVSRTLQLNRMDSVMPAAREAVPVREMLEEMFRRYAPMLEEKHIACTVQGSAVLQCDRKSLETILENLVSNAVKYTPENGSIEAVLDKKRLTLSNTVAEKIAVRDLKRPFVRGDAARSAPQGTGLGLSLAEHAALVCGMHLTLSCTEAVFSASLKAA